MIKRKPPTLDQTVLNWSRTDPAGLLAAARLVAAKRPNEQDENARRLLELITAEPRPEPSTILTEHLLNSRPYALVEAVQILNSHREEVVKVVTRAGYTDPQSIGGYLDRDLPAVQ